jgi:hypothetical protein
MLHRNRSPLLFISQTDKVEEPVAEYHYAKEHGGAWGGLEAKLHAFLTLTKYRGVIMPLSCSDQKGIQNPVHRRLSTQQTNPTRIRNEFKSSCLQLVTSLRQSTHHHFVSNKKAVKPTNS